MTKQEREVMDDLCHVLASFMAYSEMMRGLGRGHTATGKLGHSAESVLWQGRHLLAKSKRKHYMPVE
jgi:hypothetical protein